MENTEFQQYTAYMESCMKDAAHDSEHIYRVLHLARKIGRAQTQTLDWDVLETACLFHDIGRQTQYGHPELCHAQVGGQMAYDYLIGLGKSPEFAGRVKVCIQAHRFRSQTGPESLEAKILFDADKLDVTGVMGITRTLLYQGKVGTPLYTREEGEIVLSPSSADPESFLKEYNRKLRSLYALFYTEEAKRMALERQEHAVTFYENFLAELSDLS